MEYTFALPIVISFLAPPTARARHRRAHVHGDDRRPRFRLFHRSPSAHHRNPDHIQVMVYTRRTFPV